MARVWRVYDGREPTFGEHWVDIPAPEAVAAFDLSPADFVSELSKTPRFGDKKADLRHQGYKYIVIEFGPSDARHMKWKPGFYRSRVSPTEALSRIIQQVVIDELGQENVVRVDTTSATDSLGEHALRITVIISPTATDRLLQGATLNALVRLQNRLTDMRDGRTAFIEYATEAELAQDANP